MDDLVERLRRPLVWAAHVGEQRSEAADRIEALEAELAHVTEDRDLWKQSEATCNAQYNKLGAELDEARAECLEQARRIEALQAEVARLREALDESMALNINYLSVEPHDGYEFTEAPAVIEMARQALKGTDSAE